MTGARLVILYQTKRARTDQNVKSAVLVCQANGIPIVSIDTDNAESRLSMGLDSRAVHLKARGNDALETALLHADGFSQELIGAPRRAKGGRLLKPAAFLLAAALLLTGGAALYRRLRPPAAEPPADTVFFSDPGLTAAVRDALGGRPLTEQSLQTVTALRLTALPRNTDELDLLPNLSRKPPRKKPLLQFIRRVKKSLRRSLPDPEVPVSVRNNIGIKNI